MLHDVRKETLLHVVNLQPKQVSCLTLELYWNENIGLSFHCQCQITRETSNLDTLLFFLNFIETHNVVIKCMLNTNAMTGKDLY